MVLNNAFAFRRGRSEQFSRTGRDRGATSSLRMKDLDTSKVSTHELSKSGFAEYQRSRGHERHHRASGRCRESSGIKTGIASVFNIGSTAAVGTIEFEPGLQGDMPAILDKLIPPSRNCGHEQTWHDGNGHSHLQATLLGPSLTVPIADGKLVLGTWQQIFHFECDVRGRERTVLVTVVGD